MNSRDVIRHPGPETGLRVEYARGDVTRHSVQITADEGLLEQVSRLMDDADNDSGLLVLDGLELAPFDYVIPSESNDNLHAAWYSKTHSCKAARLRSATAIVGRRDGAWWMHCHAFWNVDTDLGMGHLLPETLTPARDSMVTLFAFNGGGFDVSLDVETAFSIFHPYGGRSHGNAFIARIFPHKDIHTALEELILDVGFKDASIFGIGSLVGAHFEAGEPMTCPISEVLISSQARWTGVLNLPVYCVDIENRFFQGKLLKDAAPVLVTFEVMIIENNIS